AEERFDTLVTATMGKAMQILTPTGGAKTQNVEGAMRFENERSKAFASFFESAIRYVLILIYGPELRMLMEGARRKKLELGGMDPADVVSLFPETDLVVTMTSASVVENAELRLMRNDGILTQESVAKRMARNTNIPEDEMVRLPWPDGISKDIEMPNGPKPPKPVAPKVGGKK